MDPMRMTTPATDSSRPDARRFRSEGVTGARSLEGRSAGLGRAVMSCSFGCRSGGAAGRSPTLARGRVRSAGTGRRAAAQLGGQDGCLRTALEAELGQQVGDVVLHRLLR